MPPFPLLAARQDGAEPRPRIRRSSNSPHLHAPAFSGAEPLPGDLLAARQRLTGLPQGLWAGAGEACFSPFPADAAPRCLSLSWEIAPTSGHKLPHLDLARQSPPGKRAVSEDMGWRGGALAERPPELPRTGEGHSPGSPSPPSPEPPCLPSAERGCWRVAGLGAPVREQRVIPERELPRLAGE